VRVPVVGGHSESVNIELKRDFVLNEIYDSRRRVPGVCIIDNPSDNQYPMPLYAQGKDEVFVGRIRRDASNANTLNCWIVADNLRKGAATNAIQIAEYLMKKGWL
jgi:aspartate-semialdehyde dehydrogenase